MGERRAPFVFSIRPEYVARILDGSKTVELRRRRPSMKPGEQLLIYESRARKAIVAVATLDHIVEGTPDALWDEHHEAMGIGRAAYNSYFEGSKAVGLVLRDVVELRPLALPSGMRAPQSWARLRCCSGVSVALWPPHGPLSVDDDPDSPLGGVILGCACLRVKP